MTKPATPLLDKINLDSTHRPERDTVCPACARAYLPGEFRPAVKAICNVCEGEEVKAAQAKSELLAYLAYAKTEAPHNEATIQELDILLRGAPISIYRFKISKLILEIEDDIEKGKI
jgi:hypothetical protein